MKVFSVNQDCSLLYALDEGSEKLRDVSLQDSVYRAFLTAVTY